MLKNIVVFASGTGSNFKNIKNSIDNGNINGIIVLLISNNPNCGAVIFAKKYEIKYRIINDYRYKNIEEKDNQYKLVLDSYKTDLILLAGFMKKIPINVLNSYKNKIINIHPSLLPKYGGSGYYGMKVHESVIKHNEKETGVTIHFVTEKYDEGPVILQRKIIVSNKDTPETLAERVLNIEHNSYQFVVKAFCSNKITFNKNKVIINE